MLADFQRTYEMFRMNMEGHVKEK